MKILIFSHSTFLGGAEKALIDLVNCIPRKYKAVFIFPSDQGEFVDACRENGFEVGFMPLEYSLPNPANFLLNFYRLNIKQYIHEFKQSDYDLIICNSLATLQGLVVAKMLNKPCVVYAHEYLLHREGLSPHGCSPEYFLKIIADNSNHILCASEYVKSSFNLKENKKLSVLYPFEPYRNPILKSSNSDKISILVIGAKLMRKNAHFSLTVLKALRLRGVDAELHIIGPGGDGVTKLNQQLSMRREQNVFIHNFELHPFTVGGSRKINLVCAINEPFGLTITESLYCGVPVIASRCGGPQEVLPNELLYDVNNLDQCVRAIENVINNYDHYSTFSRKLYLNFTNEKNSISLRKIIVNNSLESAIHDFYNAIIPNNFAFDNFDSILNLPLSLYEIASNISLVSQKSQLPKTVHKVLEEINFEQENPGYSVTKDINSFDVVPFAYSKNMQRLYTNGLGLAIELASVANDIGKQKMLAYVLLALSEKQFLVNGKLKILFLGDGLGIDSIKIALCGFDVDYLDFDNSLMAKCAELNFEQIKKKHSSICISKLTKLNELYDVIISLEVIEHVSDIDEFIKFINDNLKEDGCVLISECFNGIYDRWPTHLYVNENYCSSLTFLMAPYFDFFDTNTEPFGKPYFFKKRPLNPDLKTPRPTFPDRLMLAEFIASMNSIGF